MAIYALEGWDGSNQTAYWQTVYPDLTVHSGSTANNQSLEHGTDALYFFAADVTFTMPFNANAAVATLGFYTRGNSAGTFGGTFQFRDSGDGELCTFELVSDNESKPQGNGYRVRVSKGGVTIATSQQRWPSYVDWVYHEIKVTFSATVGTFEGRWTPQFSKTPQAYTWDAATTGLDLGAGPATQLYVTLDTGSASGNMALDDMYVADDYLWTGPIQIIGQLPTGAGDTQDWGLVGAASVQAALGDSVVRTADEDRISSSADDEVALVTLTARESKFAAGASLLAMVARFIGRMDTAGSKRVAAMWRNGATQAEGGSIDLDDGTWTPHTDIQLTDPTTAAAWDIDDLDGLQAGVKNLGTPP